VDVTKNEEETKARVGRMEGTRTKWQREKWKKDSGWIGREE
jgi:hypothetical protein